MLLKLAWRNIWRNKRRTYITVGSIFFGVVLSSLMMSFKNGVYDNMIDSVVGSFSGYAQIHADGYWENQSINTSFALTDSLREVLERHNNVKNHLPRLQNYALASSKDKTRGVQVVGIDPKSEQQFNAFEDRVSSGTYLDSSDQKVLVGAGLAQFLNVDVNDTLVMIGQGYHGANAAGKYAIAGLVKFGSPELSKQIVFLPIDEARWYFDAPGQLSSLVLVLHDNDLAQNTVNELQETLGNNFEVMDWKALSPEIQQMIDTDKAEGIVFMFILYMVISFGIFGTVLMMLAERQHEFGVLIALGMQKFNLGLIVCLEVIVMALFGSVVGILGALPISAYYHYNPIHLGEEFKDMIEDYGMEAVIQPSLDAQVFIDQSIVVFIVSAVISLYPLFKIMRIKAIEAMRS